MSLLYGKQVSEYDQEIPRFYTADQPTAPELFPWFIAFLSIWKYIHK